MKRIGSMARRGRRSLPFRGPRLFAARNDKQPAAAIAFARVRGSFVADQRGAIALETLIVYLFMVTALLLPLADVAAAGFQLISAWAALRSFGQYVQYFPLSNPTDSSTWPAGQTVAGYTISNIKVVCGDATPPVACTDATQTPKYYTYSTTVTLAPIGPTVLRRALCPTSCTYTLSYSERFQ